jgi:HEAT repeat protein
MGCNSAEADENMVAPDSGEPRSRFWLWLVAASAVVVVGGLLYSTLQPRQPRYLGKTSAQWFHEFQQAATNHWTTVVFTPSGTGRSLDLTGLMREPAAAGLRALGTNAAIYLGHQYARREGVLALTYMKLYFRLPASMRGFLPKPPSPRSFVRMELGWALQALGPDASASAPSLIAALRSNDRFVMGSTLGLLRGLEYDAHALDPLLEDWSKQGRYTNVVMAVAELKVRTTVAARCLARGLSAAEPAVRRSCVDELGHFEAAGAPELMTLTAALRDPDEQVRYGAARALEAIGSAAASAIPALRQATNDSSVMVQRASARALRGMQGQQTD